MRVIKESTGFEGKERKVLLGICPDTVIIPSLRFYSSCRVVADAHLFWYDIKDSGQGSLIV